MKKTFHLGLLTLAFLSCNNVFAQIQDEYKIISNEAEIPRFELTVNPLEFFTMKGINFGFGVNVKARPINRIGIDGRFRSMSYTNPYRQEYDGPNKSSFKSAGGLSAAVVGEFIWRRKGLIFMNKGGGPTGRFFLSRSSETSGNYTTTTTTFLPIKLNDLVERTLRGGFIYDNFPINENAKSQISLALGVGKRTTSTVQLAVNDQVKKQSTFFQYAFEILIGSPQYFDPTIVTENFTAGYRFIIERQFKFKNAKDIRGWKNFDFVLELGSKPGGIPYFGMTLGIPAFSIGNTAVPDDKNYKEVKAPEKFIGRFLRFI